MLLDTYKKPQLTDLVTLVNLAKKDIFFRNYFKDTNTEFMVSAYNQNQSMHSIKIGNIIIVHKNTYISMLENHDDSVLSSKSIHKFPEVIKYKTLQKAKEFSEKYKDIRNLPYNQKYPIIENIIEEIILNYREKLPEYLGSNSDFWYFRTKTYTQVNEKEILSLFKDNDLKLIAYKKVPVGLDIGLNLNTTRVFKDEDKYFTFLDEILGIHELELEVFNTYVKDILEFPFEQYLHNYQNLDDINNLIEHTLYINQPLDIPSKLLLKRV